MWSKISLTFDDEESESCFSNRAVRAPPRPKIKLTGPEQLMKIYDRKSNRSINFNRYISIVINWYRPIYERSIIT